MKKENDDKSIDDKVAKAEKKNRMKEIKSKFEAIDASESYQPLNLLGMKVREEGSRCMHHSFISNNTNKTIHLRDVLKVKKDCVASPGKRKLEVDDYTMFLGTPSTPK